MYNILKIIVYKLISANKVAKISGVKFGKNCHFGSKYFGSEPYLIEVGDNFKTSQNVKFITHDGGVNVLRNMCPELVNVDLFAKIQIGDNVFLGLDVLVLPGTCIGNNVIVGAGSVVKGILENNSVYAGVPAKFICTIDDYRRKHEKSFFYTKNLSTLEKYKMLQNYFNGVC